MAQSWQSCIDEIGFGVEESVNYTFGKAHHERGYGTFTWDSHLYQSQEDVDCWNFDMSLTGIFREIYAQKLERYYRAVDGYSSEEKCEIMESDALEWHSIDMMYSHYHIREFIRGLYESEKS